MICVIEGKIECKLFENPKILCLGQKNHFFLLVLTERFENISLVSIVCFEALATSIRYH